MRYFFLLAAAFLFLSCSSGKNNQSDEVLSPILRKALFERSSRFYADFGNFPEARKSLPIGVFDSGTGGLTVLERMLSLDSFNNITGEMVPDGIPDFEGEDFTYVADQANMPYGNYSSEGKDDYLKELAVKDALFLLGNKFSENPTDYQTHLGVKSPSKIVVIACNTATSYGLGEISKLLYESHTGVKVIGVINAGTSAFLDFISDTLKEKDLSIHRTGEVAVGVLATVGTIASGAYQRTIGLMQQELINSKERIKTGNGMVKAPFAGKIVVVNHGSAGFAESVDLESDFVDRTLTQPRNNYRGPKFGNGENDIKRELLPVYNFSYKNNDILYDKKGKSISDIQLNSAANYARFHLVSLVEKYRLSGEKAKLKAIILGCTHYPFLIDTLRQVMQELVAYKDASGNFLYKDLIASDFRFIDPAVYTAIECYKTLRSEKLLALRVADGKLDAYISVPVYGLTGEKVDQEGNLSYKYKYGRECGLEEYSTVFVPFSRRYINNDNILRIEERLPHSYKLINKILN